MAQADSQIIDGQIALEYRRLTAVDRTSLESLYDECFPGPVKCSENWYNRYLSGVGSTYAVGAFTPGPQGRMVGMIAAQEELLCQLKDRVHDIKLKEVPPLSPYATVMYIPIFCVSATYRRQGIGQSLMSGLINFINEETSHQLLYLHVNCTNHAAIKLYEKNGFKFLYRQVRYYGYTDGYADGLVYVLYTANKNSFEETQDWSEVGQSWSEVDSEFFRIQFQLDY